MCDNDEDDNEDQYLRLDGTDIVTIVLIVAVAAMFIVGMLTGSFK